MTDLTPIIEPTEIETRVKLSIMIPRSMSDDLRAVDNFLGQTDPMSNGDGPGLSYTARWVLDLGLTLFSYHQGCECENALRQPIGDDTLLAVKLSTDKVFQLRQLASDLQHGLSQFGDVNGAIKITVLEAALVAIDNGLKVIEERNKERAAELRKAYERAAPPPTQSPDN
jgi:hypothetical protein